MFVFFPVTLNEISIFFFFNDTATTEIYTLSLHDALPISDEISLLRRENGVWRAYGTPFWGEFRAAGSNTRDRKSTRLNSSHGYISYAVFCLKKKKHAENPLLVTDDAEVVRQALRANVGSS